MPTIFKSQLPDDVTPEEVVADLRRLAGDVVSVDLRPAARSGQGGRLGSIDPGTVEIIVHLLDTQAAAAVVEGIFGSFGAYLLTRTGKTPAVETKPDADEKG